MNRVDAKHASLNKSNAINITQHATRCEYKEDILLVQSASRQLDTRIQNLQDVLHVAKRHNLEGPADDISPNSKCSGLIQAQTLTSSPQKQPLVAAPP